jgi:heptosyltransferase-2
LRVQKILVIQTAFIGDVVLATGIVEKLHGAFPSARIDFLLRKGNEGLLQNHPFLHTVLVWDKRENKRHNLWRMLRRIRKERYDIVINVQRFLATGLLTAFSGAGMTIGFDKNPFSRLFTRRVPHLVSPVTDAEAGGSTGGESVHEVVRNDALVSDLAPGAPGRPRLYPTASDEAKAGIYKESPYITVSPASVWFTKQYPAEKWISFLDQLPPSVRVYLLGGPSDTALCEAMVAATKNMAVKELTGQLSFLQSVALMKDAIMNYTNDSAPMHFASAVNAPVTAVYCSTVPAFGFGPLSDIRYMVEDQEKLDCRPCGLHGYKACPLGHFHCARHIEDRQLLDTLHLQGHGYSMH